MSAARSRTSCVIGVDLGGTKLLAGVVGPDLAVRHRIRRQAFGLDQARLMATIVEAVEEARAEVEDEVAAVGFGIPVTLDRRTGTAVYSTHLPLADVPFARGHVRAARAPGGGRQRRQLRGAGRGAVRRRRRLGRRRDAHARHRHRRRARAGRQVAARLDRRGRASSGTWSIDMDGPPCQGHCPNRGCLEVMASGSALVREASLRVARRPDTALGQALEEGRELTGPFVTELAHDGDPVARDALETVGRALGVGLSSLVNVLNPEVIVIGGGVIAAGEMLLEPARARDARARAGAGARRGADRRGRVRRAGGDDRRGADGARGGGVSGGRPASARRPVAPAGPSRERPAHRLPDADRQPRGHHAARAVGAARRRRRRVRGHAPHGRAARALRRAGAARPLPRAQRARADGGPRRADARRRGRRARLGRRHAAGLRSRATCSCRAASRRGSRSRCCRGRRRRWRRWWPRRCRPTSGASRASCRASGRGWSRRSRAARRWWRSSRRSGSRRRWRCSRSSIRSGRWRSAAS